MRLIGGLMGLLGLAAALPEDAKVDQGGWRKVRSISRGERAVRRKKAKVAKASRRRNRS